jgi:GDP-mannose 6-dehydrogenase
MNISIFGLGYVGAVATACLARNGHRVVGVDTDAAKVKLINGGQSPIIEPELEAMIAEGVKAGRIKATTDQAAALAETDLTMICVGTPSKPTGELDLTFVARVCESIGRALAAKAERHLVVVRSTMLPGSMRGTVIPALERGSGKVAGTDFGVAINPEFMRESSAVQDFFHPPKTVIGALTQKDSEIVASLYAGLPGAVIHTRVEVAEMVKYVDNVFHALKITFANEIGALCRPLHIDSHEVMEIFCQDRKLNISPAYFKPGFAFGGSCLPKDLRALTRLAQTQDVTAPLLNAVTVSNERQIQNAWRLIQEQGRKKVGVLGFAFKAGTDDLRESPVVSLVETLLGKGYDLKLYDASVSLAKLIGANRRYLEQHIPHISRLMVSSIGELVEHAEIIVLGNEHQEFFEILPQLKPEQIVVDLTAYGKPVSTPARYERLCG